MRTLRGQRVKIVNFVVVVDLGKVELNLLRTICIVFTPRAAIILNTNDPDVRGAKMGIPDIFITKIKDIFRTKGCCIIRAEIACARIKGHWREIPTPAKAKTQYN